MEAVSYTHLDVYKRQLKIQSAEMKFLRGVKECTRTVRITNQDINRKKKIA